MTPPALDFGGGMAAALTHQQIVDTIAIRLNGPRAASDRLSIDWRFTDADTSIRTTLSNGALIQTSSPRRTEASDLTVTLTKLGLLGLLAGQPVTALEHNGDPTRGIGSWATSTSPIRRSPSSRPDGQCAAAGTVVRNAKFAQLRPYPG